EPTCTSSYCPIPPSRGAVVNIDRYGKRRRYRPGPGSILNFICGLTFLIQMPNGEGSACCQQYIQIMLQKYVFICKCRFFTPNA
ncbi:hypothetical protein L9F63_018307, partial [Diploptera punctata]